MEQALEKLKQLGLSQIDAARLISAVETSAVSFGGSVEDAISRALDSAQIQRDLLEAEREHFEAWIVKPEAERYKQILAELAIDKSA